MDADARVFAEHGQGLTKVQLLAELGNGCLALQNFFNRSWRQQPAGQRVLAAAGAASGEQFEKAAFSEDVEIGCVDVMGVEETVAGLSVAGPAIFDASDSSAEKRCSSVGEFLLAQNAGMISGNGDESGNGCEEPPSCEGVHAHYEPEHGCCNNCENKPDVS